MKFSKFNLQNYIRGLFNKASTLFVLLAVLLINPNFSFADDSASVTISASVPVICDFKIGENLNENGGIAVAQNCNDDSVYDVSIIENQSENTVIYDEEQSDISSDFSDFNFSSPAQITKVIISAN